MSKFQNSQNLFSAPRNFDYLSEVYIWKLLAAVLDKDSPPNLLDEDSVRMTPPGSPGIFGDADTSETGGGYPSSPFDAPATPDGLTGVLALPQETLPTASELSSLALPLATGGLGSLPGLTRAPPIKLGEGLIPAVLLLLVGLAILLMSSKAPWPMSSPAPWKPSFGSRFAVCLSGRIAGVRLFHGAASSARPLPFSDWLHQVAATRKYDVPTPMDSDSNAHTGGRNNLGRQRGSNTRAVRSSTGTGALDVPGGSPSNETDPTTASSSSSRSTALCPPAELKIMYWNIFHDFTLKLTSPDFHSMLKMYDILFFAETDMLPGEEDAANVPTGYTLLSLPRKPRLQTNRRGGGVALLIRDDIEFSKSHLSSADILVLDLGFMWLIGAYIPPVSSRWEGWTDVNPFDQLWETAAVGSLNKEKHLAVLTDINGRTASKQVPKFETQLPRTSSDATKNARGSEILRQCDATGLCILNGTTLETASPGRLTSWQPGGESTIDLAMVSEGLIPLVKSLHVELPTPDPEDDWADHVRICLTIDATELTRTPPTRDGRDSTPDFAGNHPIDVMYQETMAARETPDEALNSLWGAVLAESAPMHIYVEGVAPGTVRTKSSGAGIYLGKDSPLNTSVKVPGPGRATSDRACIYAIHEAVQQVPSDRTLVIFCSSKTVIRQLCYCAARNMAIGWPGSNGDIFKSTIGLLAARHARTTFVHVDKKDKNPSKLAAYHLAKAALRIPLAASEFQPLEASIPHCGAPHQPVSSGRKVTTELEEVSAPKVKPWKAGDTEEDAANSTHRGRAKVHALQSALQKELLACQDHKAFWDFVRKHTDVRPKKSRVSLTSLAANFESRLNHPAQTPVTFDSEQLAFNARMAQDLSTRGLTDTSPRLSYTRDITLKDIEEMKKHIKEHGLDTSVGVDGFSYKDCLAVPNEKLLEFFQFCLKNQDVPQPWLTSLLIGILKKDKDATDPSSYRLIALECCMLKMLTLIIDRRLREGAEDIGAIPKTQNGFQDSLRTNSNPFVLLCLIDKAEAEGKPLYVAYLDLKNAFPGTDRSTLWVKLAKLGIAGPMIDWLKCLYDRIKYMVRLDGRLAPAFRSLLGILTGDPGSPHLWNLFMSDFILAYHPKDVELNGVPICQVEHADDILTASSCPSGFQIHLNDSQSWVDRNGCESSIPKCLCQRFGPKQKYSPLFHLGGNKIAQVQKACYLGICFETGAKCIWREQYKVKAKKASTAANVLLGLNRFVGTLPAWDMRTLYMARVDPYLIAGCEICLDVNEQGLRLLEKVQCKFLRRMLGIGSRSLKVVLFSETGIWPIRYRRAHLALKYLCHLIGLKDSGRPAWHALAESVKLARAKKISWVNDLRIVLARLYIPVVLDITAELKVEMVETAMKSVKNSMEAWVDHEIETSVRTNDLLSGRLELDKDTGKLVKKSIDFRHYLRVKSAEHRRALTKLVLSSHSLAVERRRWKERGKDKVPREWRLCRFCRTSVEDPAHALFVCDNEDLMRVREVFLTKLYAEAPDFRGKFTSAMQLFRAVLAKREVTPILAKLAFDVLKIYDATPIFLAFPPAV